MSIITGHDHASATAGANCHITRKQRDDDRAQAIRAMQGADHLLYAIRMGDGTIKIGCTSDLARRRKQLSGEVVAFVTGSFDDEAALHSCLPDADRAHGREYYWPSPAVLSVVNQWREAFGLEPVAG